MQSSHAVSPSGWVASASLRPAVAALKMQGKSVDEVVAAKPTANYDAKWGTFFIGPDVFTRLIYAGV